MANPYRLLWMSFFLPILGLSAPLWIVGKGYIGYLEPGQNPKYWTLSADSWGLDQTRCHLWAQSNEGTPTLWRIEPKLSQPTMIGQADAILSPNIENQFITRSGIKLERRNREGEVIESFARDWIGSSSQITPLEKGHISLNRLGDELWFTHLSDDFSQVKSTPISSDRDLWAKEKLVTDGNHLWVGMTAQSNGFSYSPVVHRYKPDGTLLQIYRWDHRGILFDQCLSPEGNLLLSRDVPSQGFTVPVYPFIDRIIVGGSPISLFQAETNWMIQSFTCNEKNNYLAQNSIFGSDRARLSRWTEDSNQEEVLFSLPNRVEALLVCHP